jgi:uncharacterized protein (DUF1499 family)
MSGYWLLYLVVMMTGCSGARPSQIGVTAGRLGACPESPNCVCSQDADTRHAIAPLRYEGTFEQARGILIEALSGMKRVRIVEETGIYLRAEFTSALFRFVDDVEFLFDSGTKTIHVRSASRVGYSDLGVNRRRVEAIRSRFDTLRKERI